MPRVLCAAVAFALLAHAGCAIGWRPDRTEPVSEVHADATFSLVQYLAADRAGLRRYERVELPVDDDDPPVIYERRLEGDGLIEGHFVSHRLRPLREYLDAASQDAEPPARHKAKPPAPLDSGPAILFRLNPPVTPVPEDMQLGETRRTETVIKEYSALGRHLADGSLVRTVELEGVEEVKVPAGVFGECLRVRVKLEVSFPWGPVFELTTYIWLSRDVGEVRRVQHIAGLYWIFYFESAHQFELVEYQAAAGIVGALPPLAPEWEWGAVLFDRTFPKPRIHGMRVEYATGAASQPGP